MKDKRSPLFSPYVIDGIQMDETPFGALYDCLDGNGTVDVPEGPFDIIEDHVTDKSPQSVTYDSSKADDYVQRILRTAFDKRLVNASYPVFSTIAAIDSLLLDCLFKKGHFRLQDLLLMAKWDWNNAPEGNLAAFYSSTVECGIFLNSLGMKLDRYFVEENSRECRFDISLRKNISSRRICPDTMISSAEDWIIYIPFSGSRMSLGGSALNGIVGNGGGAGPDLTDAEYFKDCFEVARELAEDGIIVAGTATGRGGLATAAEKFRGRGGFTLETGGIISATGENDLCKILFSEIPGVIVQVKDSDYDYLDSQLLLQEVAYYPLGHPDCGKRRIDVNSDNRNSIAGILNALLNQTSSKGEN